MEILVDADDGNGSKTAELFERVKNSKITYEYQSYPQSLKVKMVNLHLSSCYSCKGFAVWVRGRLVFPVSIEENLDLRQEDFEEAATILNKSPRGAAALVHLCVQKLMPLLNQDSKKFDENISSLISRGLEVEIQQAMDVLQIIRKNPIQPNGIDMKGDQETEARLFKLLKVIMERRALKTPENN